MQISSLKFNSAYFGVTISGDGFTGSVTLSNPNIQTILGTTGSLTLAAANTLTLVGSGITAVLTGTTAMPTLTLTAATPLIIAVNTSNGLYVNSGTLNLSATSSMNFGAVTLAGNLIVTGGGTLTTGGAFTIAGGISATTALFSGAGTVTGNWLVGTASTITNAGVITTMGAATHGGNLIITGGGTLTTGGVLTVGSASSFGGPMSIALPVAGANAYLKLTRAIATTFNTYLGTTANNGYSWFTNIYYDGASFVKDKSTFSAWRMTQAVDNPVIWHLTVWAAGTPGAATFPLQIQGNGDFVLGPATSVFTPYSGFYLKCEGGNSSFSGNLAVQGTGLSTVSGSLTITKEIVVNGTGSNTCAGSMTITKDLTVNGTNNSPFAGSMTIAKTLAVTGNSTLSGTSNNFETLGVRSGANKSCGLGTLTAGSVTISNTRVTASSIIQLTIQTAGGTVGVPSKANVIAGASFDIVSTSILDTSVVGWLIVEPT